MRFSARLSVSTDAIGMAQGLSDAGIDQSLINIFLFAHISPIKLH